MRMIGIGLLGFLLAGFALLLSTMNILEKGQRYISELTDGPQLVFETRSPTTVSQTHSAVIYRSNQNHPVILSGLPAYQGVAFNMPMDARPTSGYLQIDATLQVLEGVEGVLRITIDNTRRGEMLLRPGEVGRSLQIPLTPSDFARERLVVSFSLQGERPHTTCSTDEGYEAVVEIETTSAIFLTLERPMSTVRDQISIWGQQVRVAWPDWLKPEEQLRRLVLAAQFKQRDIDTVLVGSNSSDALTTIELREALPLYPIANAGVEAPSWPRSLAQAGSNAGLRRFHDATTWRAQYDLRTGDSTRFPTSLELKLAFARKPNNAPWGLTVTLNNRLVFQGIVDGTQTNFNESITLPEDMQSANNILEIVAVSAQTSGDPCNSSPMLGAEMLPGTVLIAGDAVFSDTTTELRSALAAMAALRVGMASPLTAVDAQIASTLLADLVPSHVDMKPDNTSAQAIVVTSRDQGLILPDTGPIWLVSRDETTGELATQTIAPGSKLPRTNVAILVVPTAIDLRQVAI